MLKALLKNSWTFQRRSFKQQIVAEWYHRSSCGFARRTMCGQHSATKHHGGDHGDSARARISEHIFEPIMVEVMKIMQNMDVCQAELDMPVLRKRARTRRTEVHETKNIRNKTYIASGGLVAKSWKCMPNSFFVAWELCRAETWSSECLVEFWPVLLLIFDVSVVKGRKNYRTHKNKFPCGCPRNLVPTSVRMATFTLIQVK